MIQRLRALGRTVRQWLVRRLGRGRMGSHPSWRNLILLYVSLTLLVAGIVITIERPAWVWGGVSKVGEAVSASVEWVMPAMRRALQLDSEGAVEIITGTLPQRHVSGHEPPPATTWLMLLRSWVYMATSYDVAQPMSYLEVELPGYSRVAQSGRQTVRVPLPGEGEVDDEPIPSTEPHIGTEIDDPDDGMGPSDTDSEEPVEPLEPPLDPTVPLYWLRNADWGSEPLVAFLHVHPSEMYRTETFAPARAGDYYRFDSTDTGVIRVGERVAELLYTEYGIPVVHNKTLHDIPNFTSAYVRGRATAEELLATYPSLLMMFDIHRDGVADTSLLASVGDEQVAQVAVVIGQNNPRWEANMAMAERMGDLFHLRYPGVFRRIISVPRQTYNQDLHPHFLLLEVGNYFDHEQYALRTAKILAEVIAMMLYEERFGETPWLP